MTGTRHRGGLRLWLISLLAAACAAVASAADTPLDLLIVYTNSAESWYGADGVEAQAQAMLVSANEAFSQSNTDVRLRLAGVRKIDYEQRSDMSDELVNLGRKDGVIDEALTWRDELGADLVCLLRTNHDADNTIGVAWLLDDESGDKDTAFSVVSIDYGLSDLVLQHEIGHNLGAAHDRDNAKVEGLYSYAYGHRFRINGGQYRTVMAYDPGIQINYFSNPSIRYQGVATGVASGSASADNARALRNAVTVVSKYRAHKHKPPVARAGEDVTTEDYDGDGKESIALDGSASFVEEAGTARWTWTGGSATGLTATAHFAVGTHTVTLEVVDSEGISSKDTLKVVVGAHQVITKVYMNGSTAFLLRADGSVLGAGYQIQYASSEAVRPFIVEPYQYLDISDVVDIAIGPQHALFLKKDGSTLGMGWGSNGQLGLLGLENRIAAPTALPIADVSALAASMNGSFFVRSDGSLWTLGSGSGAYGLASGESRTVPYRAIESGVVAVCAGSSFSAALMTDGSVAVMGELAYRNYGDAILLTPETVFASEVVAIAAADNQLYALKSDGSVWGIGDNRNDELGVPGGSIVEAPVQIVASGAKAVSGGSGIAVLMQNGELWGAGRSLRTLRNRSGAQDVETITPLIGGRVAAFAVGGGNLIALRSDGSVWGVGENSYSVLGYGYAPTQNLSLLIPSLAAQTNLAPAAIAGDDISISDVFGNGGSVAQLDGRRSTDDWSIQTHRWSWPGGSSNDPHTWQRFSVGTTTVTLTVTDDGGATSSDTVKVVVRPYVGAAKAVAAERAILLIKRDGSLWGIGQNYSGGLGPARYEYGKVEASMLMEEGVSSVFSDGYSTLIRKSDGSLWTCGPINAWLEDERQFEILKVPAIGAVRSSIGSQHVVWIDENGDVWGVGRNQSGQLSGDAALTFAEPVKLPFGPALDVVACGEATIALGTDGRVRGMGVRIVGERGEVVDFGLHDLTRIWIGDAYQFLALQSNGDLWGMRAGFDGETLLGGYSSFEPYPVLIDGQISDLSVSQNAIAALRPNGAVDVRGWGQYYGFASRYSWESLAGGGISGISSGRNLFVAVGKDGSVWARGNLPNISAWDLGDGGSRLLRILKPDTDNTLDTVAPIADAGPDIDIESVSWESQQHVTLDGSGSRDNGIIQRLEWSWDGGVYYGARVSDYFPQGTTECKLTVWDAAGNSAQDTVRVTVRPGSPMETYFADGSTLYGLTEEGNLFVATPSIPEVGYELSTPSNYRRGVWIAEGVASVAAAGGSLCIIGRDGSLRVAGKNGDGQLGLGDRAHSAPLTQVFSAGVRDVAIGGGFILVQKSDGSLWGSGRNESGQLGRDRPRHIFRFEKVVDSEVSSFAAGTGYSLYATSEGEAWSLGRDLSRPPDMETDEATQNVLARFPIANVTSVEARDSRYFLITTEGAAWGGGNNYYGALGYGNNFEYAAAPAQVFESGVSSISIAVDRTFFAMRDGSLKAVGNVPEISLTPFGGRAHPPQTIASGGVTALAASDSVAVVRRSDGAVYGLGSPYYLDFGTPSGSYQQGWWRLHAGDGSWSGGPPVIEKLDDRVAYARDRYDKIADPPEVQGWLINRRYWYVNPYASSITRDESLLLNARPGVYMLTYVANDADGITTTMSFDITIKSYADFLNWLTKYMTVEEAQELSDPFTADLDGDGLSNRVEAMLGLDPTDADSRVRLTIKSRDGQVFVEYAPLSESVDFMVEESSDLSAWSVVHDILWVDPSTARLNVTPDDRIFLRATVAP